MRASQATTEVLGELRLCVPCLAKDVTESSLEISARGFNLQTFQNIFLSNLQNVVNGTRQNISTLVYQK